MRCSQNVCSLDHICANQHEDEEDLDPDVELYISGSWSGWTKMELMERKGPGGLLKFI